MLVPIADTGNLNQTYPHPGSFSIRNLIIESKQLIATHDKERRSMNLMRQIKCLVGQFMPNRKFDQSGEILKESFW
ncbi:MAG TPA: hypothetical protein DEX36_13735 [Glutamicibacter sp.]|nr:hypothetical protein [Glutamicibacter sp.]